MARYHGPRRRVLVVDDVAANRTLMCDCLANAGFEVAQGVEHCPIALERVGEVLLIEVKAAAAWV